MRSPPPSSLPPSASGERWLGLQQRLYDRNRVLLSCGWFPHADDCGRLSCSPRLESLTYTADGPAALHAVVSALPSLPHLTSLSLTARTFAIPPETARLIGRLPLTSLRLDSAVCFLISYSRCSSPST